MAKAAKKSGPTIAQMVCDYNYAADELGEKQVNTFTDNPTGVKRLAAILARLEAKKAGTPIPEENSLDPHSIEKLPEAVTPPAGMVEILDTATEKPPARTPTKKQAAKAARLAAGAEAKIRAAAAAVGDKPSLEALQRLKVEKRWKSKLIGFKFHSLRTENPRKEGNPSNKSFQIVLDNPLIEFWPFIEKGGSPSWLQLEIKVGNIEKNPA